jgi:hypothetical protein
MELAQDIILHEIHQLVFFLENGLLPDEDVLVNKRIRELSRSNNHKVRLALVKALGNLVYLPKDIALKFSRDSIDISKIIIAGYPKFEINDLLSIIETSVDKNAKMSIVIERKYLPSHIIDYICENASKEVILKLLARHKRSFKSETIAKILNRFNGAIELLNGIKSLKVNLKELLPLLNEQVKELITGIYNLKYNYVAAPSLSDLQNLSLLNIGKTQAEHALRAKIDVFYAKNSLSYFIVLKMLCQGDIYSFIYSISKCSDANFIVIRDHLFNLEFKEVNEGLALMGTPADLIDALTKVLAIIILGLKKGEVSKENFAQYVNQKIYESQWGQEAKFKYISSLIGKTPIQRLLF